MKNRIIEGQWKYLGCITKEEGNDRGYERMDEWNGKQNKEWKL